MHLLPEADSLVCVIGNRAYRLWYPPILPDGHTWRWNVARGLYVNSYDDRLIAVYAEPSGVRAVMLDTPADPTM